MMKNLPHLTKYIPKEMVLSDLLLIFAMSLIFLLLLYCSTKISENSDISK